MLIAIWQIKSEKNGHHFTGDIYKYISLNETFEFQMQFQWNVLFLV